MLFFILMSVCLNVVLASILVWLFFSHLGKYAIRCCDFMGGAALN
jgi:hypothetical protein